MIIIGLDPEATGAIINNAKHKIEKGLKFLEGINYPYFLVDLPIQFIEVKKEHYSDYLGYAGWYNNSTHFPALQMVWPDTKGNFPWASGFNKKIKFKQPLLDSA